VLPAGTEGSCETWIEGPSYPKSKREQFRQLRYEAGPLTAKQQRCKSFIKTESYDTYKAPRGINSYSDRAKAFVGAYAHAADEALFSLKWFVKHQDVRLRPKLLRDAFGFGRVKITDYTSFEAHHSDEFFEVGMMWKEHILAHVGGSELFLKLEHSMCSGQNVCRFRAVIAKVWQRLMSGKMTTSSDNGVLNLMLTAYLLTRSNNPALEPEQLVGRVDDYNIFVEGDDGIFDDAFIDEKLISDLGVKVKMESFENCAAGSFCGIVSDLETLDNVADPRKVLADFALMDVRWLNARRSRHRDLLRAKAFSYGYAYGACPIIAALANYVLRCTRGRDVAWTLQYADEYHRSNLASAVQTGHAQLFRPVQTSTRLVVQRLFGISVERQLQVELYLDSSSELHPLNLDMEFPELWCVHADKYVSQVEGLTFPKPFYPEVVARVRQSGIKDTTQRAGAFEFVDFGARD
jgi:hypothetical protein